jgi:putative ABC transport system permease protein
MQILALVVRISATLVLIGGAAGLAVATPIALVMRSAFFGLSPWSPWAMLPTIGLLLLVAVAATAVPVYRAVRVDPLTALREP